MSSVAELGPFLEHLFVFEIKLSFDSQLEIFVQFLSFLALQALKFDLIKLIVGFCSLRFDQLPVRHESSQPILIAVDSQ